VFDVRGRAVHRADLGMQRAGLQRAVWDGNDSSGQHVGSGVYYVLLRAGGEVQRQRVTVLR
jgi:flagellar hook assembly protein FlgD